MPFQEFEVALYNLLSADSALVSLLGGTAIYNQRAVQNPGDSYVVFSWQGGGDENITPTRSRNVLYTVQGVSTSPEMAGSINDKIDDALNGQSITPSGWNPTMIIRRETDVQYNEDDGTGSPIFHYGGIYRFIYD